MGPDIDGHLRGKHRRVLVGEAGVLGGASTTLAGLAAAGSVTLSLETGRAGAGEKTPLEVAEGYAKDPFCGNVHLSDAYGWVRGDYAKR